jgi:hypothetical protein
LELSTKRITLYGDAGRVAQVVECLPDKCKALTSTTSTSKKLKNKVYMERQNSQGRQFSIEEEN